MLFNQIVVLIFSIERIGSFVVRKQVILDLRELVGNGLEQEIVMGNFCGQGVVGIFCVRGLGSISRRLEGYRMGRCYS